MMKRLIALGFAIIVFAFIVFPSQLQSQEPIPVVNASFEEPGTEKLKSFVDVPGWSTDTDASGSSAPRALRCR